MVTIEAKPKVQVDKEIKALIEQSYERCTIVHCKYFVTEISSVRIWKSTFLIEENGNKCGLIKPFNISIAPDWTTHFIVNDFIYFTLIFEGLSKNCGSFYLFEDIPEPGGFYSDSVLRNNSDVYTVEVK
jgi:hypothetical protein